MVYFILLDTINRFIFRKYPDSMIARNQENCVLCPIRPSRLSEKLTQSPIGILNSSDIILITIPFFFIELFVHHTSSVGIKWEVTAERHDLHKEWRFRFAFA